MRVMRAEMMATRNEPKDMRDKCICTCGEPCGGRLSQVLNETS